MCKVVSKGGGGLGRVELVRSQSVGQVMVG